MECWVGIGSTKKRIIEPVGSDDPDGGHHSGVGRKGTKYTSAGFENFLVTQRGHGLSFLARNPCGEYIGLAVDFLKATNDLVPITWQEFLSQIFGSPSQFHATETWFPKGTIEFDKDFLYFAESDGFDGFNLITNS